MMSLDLSKYYKVWQNKKTNLSLQPKLNTMKKTTTFDIWMISNISVFLGQGIDTTQGDSVYWHLDNGSQLEIDFDSKEVKFVDWRSDDKTYFAIIGMASSRNFTTNDYFTDKN